MLQEALASEFIASSVGRYATGRTFLVWCVSPTLSGAFVWGAHDPRDARDMLSLWDHDRKLQDFYSILDVSGLRWVEPATVNMVSAHVAAGLDRYARTLRRQSIILPREPITAAVVAGVPVILDIRHQWRVFTEEREALAWLELGELSGVYDELKQLVQHTQAQTKLLIELRDYLSDHLNASIDSAARAIGASSRSLQRHLSQQRTSFRAELKRARAQAGAHLLASTEQKLEAIAQAVGYTSTSHFTTAFVDEIGEDPQAYRRLRRGDR